MIDTQTDIQKYVIHQIRNSIRYVSYKDVKKVTADLKPIYKAATEQAAQLELDRFEEIWGDKYPLIVRSWRQNWEELATFFKNPPDESLLKIALSCNDGCPPKVDGACPELGANLVAVERVLP